MNAGLVEAIRLYGSGKFDPALTVLLETEAQEGEELEFAYYIGLCYARLRRYEDSLLYLEQIITACPDPQRVFQCRLALAFIYSVTKRNKLAEYELKQLLDSGVNSAQVYSALGYTSYEQGRAAEALEYYRKALEIEPENASALNSAGYIMANEGIDSKKALAYCRKALELNPNNTAYLDSIGWAFYRSGMVERARVYLERAARQEPSAEIIQSHFRIANGEPS
jgi:tetratricopeptide (TPR) repeat protein